MGMTHPLNALDRVGLVRPAVDAHTLGLSHVAELLGECGVAHVLAPSLVCEWLNEPLHPESAAGITRWLREEHITVLGYSFRLDPETGFRLFHELMKLLGAARLLSDKPGSLRGVYFAGLPEACSRVERGIPGVDAVLSGEEGATKTLALLGVAPENIPVSLAENSRYDEARLAFGKELVARGEADAVRPVDRSASHGFGTVSDSLLKRLEHGSRMGLPPLMRAHVGPFLPDRKEAVGLFREWTRRLARGGMLDVLSIGSSQLTQEAFSEAWHDRPNGGGVPLNSVEELAQIWEDARPMLVRTYAGTRHVPWLAQIHEQHLHIAWHALSFWWFCRSDGRGPNSVRQNLEEHLAAMRFIASSGKPLEPNVSHHFAFRGADDTTYIVAAVLAARAAKAQGIRHLVLQNMLNTPRQTWGVQDLAKSRAMLRLVRRLETPDFRVTLQPRGGLDYFSVDHERAKCQLAAISALMVDLDPEQPKGPPMVHVVSYSEGTGLADPGVVEESIRITRAALLAWSRLKERGAVEDIAGSAEVSGRTEILVAEASALLDHIDRNIPQPESADGLYRIMAAGYLPVPHLAECRDEFPKATSWKTRVVRGGQCLVDDMGRPMTLANRLERLKEMNSPPSR